MSVLDAVVDGMAIPADRAFLAVVGDSTAPIEPLGASHYLKHVTDQPLVTFDIDFDVAYRLNLAGLDRERNPLLHIFISHNMTKQPLIVPLPQGGHQLTNKVPVSLRGYHRGKLPADAKIHVRLFVEKYNKDASAKSGTPVWVKTRVGAGALLLSKLWPKVTAKNDSIGLELVQTTADSVSKGVVVFRFQGEDKGLRVSDGSLERIGGSRNLFGEAQPWEFLAETQQSHDDIIEDYLETTMTIYMDNQESGACAYLQPPFERLKRVRMPYYMTPLRLIPPALYTLPPSSLVVRTRDEWRKVEPFARNIARIALKRRNVGDEEFIQWVNDQESAARSGDRYVLPTTRYVEAAVQEVFAAVANRLTYTDDSIYVLDGEGRAKKVGIEDFGNAWLRNTEDCEGFANMSNTFFWIVKNVAWEDPVLQALQRTTKWYVPTMNLSLVDSASLSGSAGRDNFVSHSLKDQSPAEMERSFSKAAAHMFFALVPTPVFLDRVKRVNGPGEIRITDPDQANLRTWQRDLITLTSEGTGHMLSAYPANVLVDDSERERVSRMMVQRGKLNEELSQNIPVLYYTGSPTFMVNDPNALKSMKDRDYGNWAPFYQGIHEVFTPFFFENGILQGHMLAVDVTGGPYKDGQMRSFVRAEEFLTHDDNVGLFMLPPMNEETFALSYNVYASHLEPTPMPTLVDILHTPDAEFKNPTLPREAFSADADNLNKKVEAVAAPFALYMDSDSDSDCSEPINIDDRADDDENVDCEDIVVSERESYRRLLDAEDTIGQAMRSDEMIRVHQARAFEDAAAAEPVLRDRLRENAYSVGRILKDREQAIIEGRQALIKPDKNSKLYSEMTNAEKRWRGGIDFYFPQKDFTPDIVHAVAALGESSKVLEGYEITPEVFTLDARGNPLNACVRLTIYPYKV